MNSKQAMNSSFKMGWTSLDFLIPTSDQKATGYA